MKTSVAGIQEYTGYPVANFTAAPEQIDREPVSTPPDQNTVSCEHDARPESDLADDAGPAASILRIRRQRAGNW